MSNPETESQYSQPELPFPEGSLEHDTRVINETIPEGQFAVSSIRDVLGAWKNHFKERRNRSLNEPVVDDRYHQPELPFEDAERASETEVIDRTVSEEQTAVSSVKQVVRAWKSHLKENHNKNEEFHASLKASTQARLTGKAAETERVVPRTRAERRAEIKAEKSIYKHARAKENARWADAVHGTHKGAVSKGETRKARKDVIKAAKQLHKDGVIDGRELMKRIHESAGILKYDENATQKRARKKVDTAAEKVLKKSSQPRLRRFAGARLASTGDESVTQVEDTITETASSQEVTPTEIHDIPVVAETSEPVKVTVHKRSELFRPSKAKSFKFDRQGKLTSTHTGPLPKQREKPERAKGEKSDKRKPREAGIPKEALSLFDRTELEAAYKRIDTAIEAGKDAWLDEYNKDKPADEQLSVFPRTELGEVVANARRAEIQRMLGDNHSEEDEHTLMNAFTAIHQEEMKRKSGKAGEAES